jgi:hypothetical protein
MKPNPTPKPFKTAWTLSVMSVLCLTANLMSGCATQTSEYGPVLLSDAERACLSRDAKEAIEANNETWLQDNE